MKENCRKMNLKDYRTRIFMFAVLILCYSFSHAQSRTITGSVIDKSSGEAMPGVTVVIKGTTSGGITDMAGSFSIKAESGQTLVFSFIGYNTQEYLLANEGVVNIQLASTLQDIDEVVVIGYGTVKKEDATGSVAAVAADDFQQGAITSPQSLIVGKTPGVVVTTNDGQPGAGATIRIRGGSSLNASNDPLIVIDGLPMDSEEMSGVSNPLSLINPNDIESFSILKDASATAIYGSRASNGVILITTKKGTSDKLKVSYNGFVSFAKAPDFIDVLTGDQMRAVVQDRVDNYGLDEAALALLGDANTDWQDEVYRTAISTDHNFSLMGNFAGIPVRASVGRTIENGILEESNMKRTTLSINAVPTFFDGDLKVTINAKGMDINNDFSNDEAIGGAMQFDPTQPITNGNTLYGGYTAWTTDGEIDGAANNIGTHNPVALIKFKDNTSDAYHFIGNVQFDYKLPFLEGLKANLNMGLDYAESEGKNNNDERASWGWRELNENIQDYSDMRNNKLLNLYLSYNKNFGDHNVDIVGGYEWQHFYRKSYNANKGWDADEWYSEVTQKSENYLVSFFGRMNYNYGSKYLLTATLRADGSSRFSEDTRWGYFPAFAAAWRLSEEGFIKGINAISNLKLKVGYGITGQQDISDNYYPYLPIYEQSVEGAYYYFDGEFIPTLRANSFDPDIKWEETTTINFGLEFGLFKNRLTGSFDLYQRKTEDLISTIPIAAGVNNSNYLTTNVGSLKNDGIEAELNWRIISKEDMFLEFGANISANTNEITALGGQSFNAGTIQGGTGNQVQYNTEGFARNTFYLFQQLYDENGKPIEGEYYDRVGDGNVTGNNDNKFLLGNPDPDYVLGINSKFGYKKFDFSFAGRYSKGNYVYNNIHSQNAIYQDIYRSGFTRNLSSAVLKTNFATAQYWSDYYLEDASFFRMDNISLGYSFDKFVNNKVSGRVSFTVNNAFVITDYSGLDPEVEDGIDDNIYPRPRIFMVGLNLNF